MNLYVQNCKLCYFCVCSRNSAAAVRVGHMHAKRSHHHRQRPHQMLHTSAVLQVNAHIHTHGHIHKYTQFEDKHLMFG